MPESPTNEVRARCRALFAADVADPKGYKGRKVDPNFKFPEPLKHGWLQPHLLSIEGALWGRWDHRIYHETVAPTAETKIPQIQWDTHSAAHARARKMLEQCLDATAGHGSWHSWGSFANFEYLMQWILFALGHPGHPTEPAPPSEGASERLYQLFDIGLMLLAPSDYWGDILAENAHGRQLGFFPTPLTLSDLMAQMLFVDSPSPLKTVCDCCVGTGRMLLAASNYSYRLFGQDINRTVILATLVNGFLYAPWLVAPFKHFAEEKSYTDPSLSAAVSDQLANLTLNDAKATAYLGAPEDSENDRILQPSCEPLKIRRRKHAQKNKAA